MGQCCSMGEQGNRGMGEWGNVSNKPRAVTCKSVPQGASGDGRCKIAGYAGDGKPIDGWEGSHMAFPGVGVGSWVGGACGLGWSGGGVQLSAGLVHEKCAGIDGPRVRGRVVWDCVVAVETGLEPSCAPCATRCPGAGGAARVRAVRHSQAATRTVGVSWAVACSLAGASAAAAVAPVSALSGGRRDQGDAAKCEGCPDGRPYHPSAAGIARCHGGKPIRRWLNRVPKTRGCAKFTGTSRIFRNYSMTNITLAPFPRRKRVLPGAKLGLRGQGCAVVVRHWDAAAVLAGMHGARGRIRI